MTNVPPPETTSDDITLIVPMPPPGLTESEDPPTVLVEIEPEKAPPNAAKEGEPKGAE